MPIYLKTDSKDWLEQAAQAIREKKIVAIAYERLFGLAADALDKSVVAKVAAIKDRDPDAAGSRPIAVILPNAEAAGLVTPSLSTAATRLSEQYWPGPLTLIVPALPNLPPPLVSKAGTIGIRLAGPSPAAMLARCSGLPLTATSANRAGETDALHHADMEGIDGIDVIVEGIVAGPPGSTVVDVTQDTPRILRAGILSIEEF